MQSVAQEDGGGGLPHFRNPPPSAWKAIFPTPINPDAADAILGGRFSPADAVSIPQSFPWLQ